MNIRQLVPLVPMIVLVLMSRELLVVALARIVALVPMESILLLALQDLTVALVLYLLEVLPQGAVALIILAVLMVAKLVVQTLTFLNLTLVHVAQKHAELRAVVSIIVLAHAVLKAAALIQM